MRPNFPARTSRIAIITLATVGATFAYSVFAKPSNDVVWSDEEPPAPTAAQSAATVPADALGITAAAPAGTGSMTAPGVVQSAQEAVIASRMTALITALPLDAGQQFARGQLLASFDCSQMRAQLSAASAAASAYRKTYDTNVELDHYKAIGTNEVGVSKANLGKATAEAQAIQAGLGQCAIFAPFAGTVVERSAHPHDVAAAGQPLMTIQGSGDLKVELIIPSAWLTWVKPGTPFRFAINETGNEIAGRVARLGASVDPVSKTMRITGAIVVRGAVLPGMSGTARFEGS